MCNVETKYCKRCDSDKLIDQFYASTRSYCIPCERVDAAERMREYGATLKGKASKALQNSRRNARNIDDLTLMDVIFTFAASNGECCYCGEDVGIKNITLDHIVPLSEGGANTFANITAACSSCNRSKNSGNLLDWHNHGGKTTNEAILGVIDLMASRRAVSHAEVKAELTGDV